VNASLMPKLPYDTATDFAPVALLATLPSLVVVNPGLPAKDMKDLIGLAKAKPGSVTYASSGTGSTSHMSAALLSSMAGVQLVHVPYKGASAALNDVMGGQVQMTIDVAISAMPQVKAGKLRALGVLGTRPNDALPGVPTAVEAGFPQFSDAIEWYGVVAPAATPREVVVKLNGAVVRALKDPEVSARLNAIGQTPAPSTPEEFAAQIRGDYERWGKVVKASGAKAE
jgi:tripartite-type tricarboxylate transporter receptor subunit TctC